MVFLASITLQTNSLADLYLLLPQLAQYSQFVLMTHPQLYFPYGETVLAALKQFKRPIMELWIPQGERSKSLKQATHCWQQMCTQGVDRRAAVIALGGGVIGDLAGFVASCYMRGLDVFYLPTTLLAMVDAAIGGKTGINLANAKNAIGTFHHPTHILIDPICLLTLPSREFNSGLAEVIKYGMTQDLILFEKLEERIDELHLHQGAFLEEVIGWCVALKSAVVAQDEKDQNGKRAALNYGHTFGHAIESVTHYQRYLHGEAVAIGMSCAANLSVRLGLCEGPVKERQDQLCHRADLPLHLPHLAIKRLIAAMKRDKKSVGGKINLILPERIGKVLQVYDVDSLLIQDALLT